MKTNFTEVMLTNKHPTIVICSQGVILDCNDEMVKLLRAVNKDDIIGKDYLNSFIDEKERQLIRDNIMDVLAGSPTWGYENSVIDHAGIRHVKYWSAISHPYNKDIVIAWASDLDNKSNSIRELHKFIDAFAHHMSRPLSTLLLLEPSLQKSVLQDIQTAGLLERAIRSLSENIELLRVFNQSLMEHVVALQLKDVEKVLRISFPPQTSVCKSFVHLQPSLLYLLQQVICKFRETGVGVAAYVQNHKLHMVFKPLFIEPLSEGISRPLVFHLLRTGLSMTECGEVQEGDGISPITVSFDII